AFTRSGVPVSRDRARRSSSSARTCRSTTPRVSNAICSSTGGKFGMRSVIAEPRTARARYVPSSVRVVVAAGDGQVPAVVHELLQLLADFEKRQPLRGHGHRRTRARVAPRVRLVGANGEAPETANLDAVAPL